MLGMKNEAIVQILVLGFAATVQGYRVLLQRINQ